MVSVEVMSDWIFTTSGVMGFFSVDIFVLIHKNKPTPHHTSFIAIYNLVDNLSKLRIIDSQEFSMENKLKRMLQAKEQAIGFWLNFPSPDLAEFIGLAGFDFIVIDAEHYFFGAETILNIVRAAKMSDCTPILRVSKNDQALILGYLEAGVDGIIVPHINNRAGAEAAVRAVKYPPHGSRSVNSVTRATKFGLAQSPEEFLEKANRESLVIVMVEETEAIKNLPDILRVEGIDSVFIGPEDLSASMGYLGQPGHPEVQIVIKDIESQIRSSDKALGRLGTTSQAAKQAFEEGANYFVLFSSVFLGKAFMTFLTEARNLK